MLLLMKKNIVYNKGKVSVNHKHLQMLVYTALL